MATALTALSGACKSPEKAGAAREVKLPNVRFDPTTGRYEWSAADTEHLAARYGFHGWNPPDMSNPMDLSDLGGGAVNNDGRYVNGSGTMAGRPGDRDEMFRQSAVNFLNTYDGDKPFCLIVALVNPHDVQEYPGRGLRGSPLRTTFEQGGYRLEDFANLPIGLPANVDDDLSTKPSVQKPGRNGPGGVGSGRRAS